MRTRLADLVPLLQCVGCGAAGWTDPPSDGDGGLVCGPCGRAYRLRDGVLMVSQDTIDASVQAERAAVIATERDARQGGHADFDAFMSATGALRAAILSLPWGTESRYYDEPGYFANVRASAAAFEWVRANLSTVPGARLLDVGADLTWSTAGLARAGFDCTAIDINHHLPLASLFQAAFGVDYRLVNVDAHVPVFRDETFDVITAFSALHHSHRLDELIANLVRTLKPGGRLGFVEPYCVTEEERQRFGKAQIDLGINENVYTLVEWHAALRRAGLRQHAVWLSGSFNAIYVKDPAKGSDDDDPLARFYGGSIDVLEPPLAPVRPGEPFVIGTRITNRSRATWSSHGTTPVCPGYHLHRVLDDAREEVAFDNPRTALARDLPPGCSAWCDVRVTAPTRPGTYEVDLDLVHERVTWFVDRGFGAATLRFVVS